MSARREITKRYAKEYRAASKKARGILLDELVAVTGWSRDNARRQVAQAGKRRGPAKAVRRKPRAPIYGYDTLKVLQQVWAKMGMPSGKYLAATMADTLAALDRFAELDGPRYTPEVRIQLLVMSAATRHQDRVAAPGRDLDGSAIGVDLLDEGEQVLAGLARGHGHDPPSGTTFGTSVPLGAPGCPR